MSSYKTQLELKIKELRHKIESKYEALPKYKNDFKNWSRIVGEINSLSVDLKTTKDRLFHMDKPQPYLPDAETQSVINQYV